MLSVLIFCFLCVVEYLNRKRLEHNFYLNPVQVLISNNDTSSQSDGFYMLMTENKN